MCQRFFCARPLQDYKSKSIKYLFYVFLLFPLIAFSQQKQYTIDFQWCTATESGLNVNPPPTFPIKGKTPRFPNTIMSLVTIRDQDGRYIHSLADTSKWLGPDDFALNGQLVNDIWGPYLEYHVEDTTKPADNNVKPHFEVLEFTDLGVSVALAMDFSASMADTSIPDWQNWFDPTVDAGKTFIRNMQLHKADSVAIVKFDSTVFVTHEFTQDTAGTLWAAVDSLPAWQSGTGVFDAMYEAVTLCLGQTQQRAVVAYTDGGDHGYGRTEGDVIDYARANDVPVFTIFVGDTIRYSNSKFALQRIADRTGGEYFHVPNVNELDDVYLSVYGLLRGSYVLAHRTTDRLPDGTWRWVDVTVDNGNGSGGGRGQYWIDLIRPNVSIEKFVVTDSINVVQGDTLHIAMARDTINYYLDVTSDGKSWAPYIHIVDIPGDSLIPVDFEPMATILPDSLVPLTPTHFTKDSLVWDIPSLETGEKMRIGYRARLADKLWLEDVEQENFVTIDCLNDSIATDNEVRTTALGFGLPDFVIQCVEPAIAASPGYPYTLKAIVQNIGSADIDTTFKVGFYIDGMGTDPVVITETQGVMVGNDLQVEGVWQNPTAGSYVLRTMVDLNNDVEELLETNNWDNCNIRVGIDTLVVRVSDVSLTDFIRGKMASFPDPVLSSINVWDQNQNPIRDLADTTRYLGLTDVTQIGETVNTVWEALLEYHQNDPMTPTDTNVKPSMEVTEISNNGFSLVMAVDKMQDLAGWEANVQNAWSRFIDRYSSSDWGSVISIGADTQVEQAFTQDEELLKSSYNFDFDANDRLLYDGLEEGINQAFLRGGRNAVLATVGGEDTGSALTALEIIQSARQNAVPIYIIGLGGASVSADLQYLCDESGGLFYGVTDSSDIDDAFVTMHRLLTNYYVVSHASSDTVKNDTWRTLDATVAAYGHRGSDTGDFHVALGSMDLSVEKYVETDNWEVHPTTGDTTWYVTTNDTVHYTVLIRNLGHQEATSVPVRDVLPSNFSLISTDVQPSDVSGQTIQWVINSIPISGYQAIHYSCYVDTLFVSDTTSVSNLFTLQYPPDSDPSNDVIEVPVDYIPLDVPNIQVTKVGVGGDPVTTSEGTTYYVEPGDTVSYKLNLTNVGELDAFNVNIQDVLPSHLIILNSTPAATVSGDTLNWTISRLVARGGSAGVSYSCLVDSVLGYETVPLTNFANISWVHEEVDYNVSVQDTVYFTPLDPPDLSISKVGRSDRFVTSGNDTTYIVEPGDVLDYTLRIVNNGEIDALDVNISDELPMDLTFLESTPPANVSGSNLTWSIDRIAARGGVAEIRYSCFVDSVISDVNLNLVNLVLVDWMHDEIPYEKFERDTVIFEPLRPPDINLTKRAIGDSAVVAAGDTTWYCDPGDIIQYRISMVNEGEFDALNVQVTDILPDKATFVDATPAATVIGDTLKWLFPRIDARGGSATITYRCAVDSAIHPQGDFLVNNAIAYWIFDNEETTRAVSDTIYVKSRYTPPPEIMVTPKLVHPGDSVLVEVMTPVEIIDWDLIVTYETGELVEDYGDQFITLNPTLDPTVWTAVIPRLGDTSMRTDKILEVIAVTFSTIDTWNQTAAVSDSFQVEAVDEFFLDENVYKPGDSTPLLGMRYRLSSNRNAQIRIYDIAGSYVDTVIDGPSVAGWNYVTWDGRDENDRPVGSGVYVAILISGDFQKARKFILVR